jgi:hypothetical protein
VTVTVLVPSSTELTPKTLPTATPSTTPPKASLVGAVARAIGGGAAALLLVAAIVTFVLCRRRRRSYRRFSGDSSSAMRPVSRIGPAPFVLTRLGATRRDPSHQPELRQSRSGSINPAEMAANAEADSLPSSPLHSDFNSQPLQFVPVGLSAKELAQMRAGNLRAQAAQPTTPSVLDESRPPSGVSSPAPVATTEQRLGTSSTALLTVQSQLDRIWREIQQLRAERLGSEAPPSYGDNRQSV